MKIDNQRLKKYLDKRKKQGTVILCFKILLDYTIKHGLNATMTKSQINEHFDRVHKNFGIGTFRSDYLLRQTSNSKDNAIGVKLDNSTFFIRNQFLNGLSKQNLIEISLHIENYYKTEISKQRTFIQTLYNAMKLDTFARKEFILDMLLKTETEKKGQSFEVTAYAILKTFYGIRGFDLNRFSTVYSNDGGIDFTSQIAVYQVTTKLSNRKFEDDIEKAPLKKRIFVYRSKANNFDMTKFNHELVLDYISGDDLVEHLEYLFKKKAVQNSKKIIQVIIGEFEREYYL